jgi:hypothetical protein
MSYIVWFISYDCANAETRVNMDDKVNAVLEMLLIALK